MILYARLGWRQLHLIEYLINMKTETTYSDIVAIKLSFYFTPREIDKMLLNLIARGIVALNDLDALYLVPEAKLHFSHLRKES